MRRRVVDLGFHFGLRGLKYHFRIALRNIKVDNFCDLDGAGSLWC